MKRSLLSSVFLALLLLPGLASAAITYVGSGTVAESNNADLDANLHASSTTNDVLLVFGTKRGGTGSVDSVDAGSYTSIATIESDRRRVFGKLHDGSEDSTPLVDITPNAAGDTVIAGTMTFRGVLQDTIANMLDGAPATQSNTSAQDVAYPALTVNGDGRVVVLCIWKAGDWSADGAGAVGGFTKAFDYPTATGGDASAACYYQIQTTGANISAGTITITGGEAQTSIALLFALEPAAACASTPTITDVDSDESVTGTQANVVVTLTGGCASQGTGAVTLRQNGNSKTLAVDSWSDTSIQADMSGVGFGVASGLRYGSMDLRITNDAANTDDQAITVTAPSGVGYADLSGGLVPLTWDDDGNPSRPHGYPTDVSATSQVAWGNVTGCTSSDIVWNVDGTLQVDPTCTALEWDFTISDLYNGTEASIQIAGAPPSFGGLTIPNQIYAKDVAIIPYDLDDYFALGDAALSAYTFKQLSAPSAVDQANGAGTASTTLIVDDWTGIAAGDWIKVGTAYSRVKYVDPFNDVIGLWYSITWADNDTVSTMTVGNCSVSGLSINGTTHNFEGTPDTAETNALCLFRLTDADGLTADSP